MDEQETAELTICIECGAEVWPERDRSYLLSEEDALCYECARKRGGAYDELSDRWARAPNLAGLTVSAP